MLFHNGPHMGAGLLEPFFHLRNGDHGRIIDNAVDLAVALPALMDRDDAGPPCQGGNTDIVSADHKGDRSRIGY